MTNDLRFVWALIGLCALVGALTLLQGCNTLHDTARGVVNSSGIALAAADRTAAIEYAAAAREALEASENLQEYEAAMAPWNALEETLRATRHVLEACEDAVDAWDMGGEEDWMGLASELLASMENIANLLVQLGVPVPEPLLNVLQLASQFEGNR